MHAKGFPRMDALVEQQIWRRRNEKLIPRRSVMLISVNIQNKSLKGVSGLQEWQLELPYIIAHTVCTKMISCV